jgi:anti-repressor protein
MNELIKIEGFCTEQYGVKTITKGDEIWFLASDVCNSLDLSNVSQALTRLDDDEKDIISNDTPGGTQEMLVISESGLYSLVLSSRKPDAKMFKRWVTHEVIPAIRKTGKYEAKKLTGPELMAMALIEADSTIKNQAKQIEAMKPAAQFYADVTGSRDAISIADAAKIIGMGYGQNKLFALLRDNGVLMAGNVPYQKYIDQGWFRVVEQKYEAKGETKISIKTLVFQKGIDGIIKLIRKLDT